MAKYSDFINAIKASSQDSVRAGKERALKYLKRIGLSDRTASDLYQKVSEAYRENEIALSMPIKMTETLLTNSHDVSPALNNPSLSPKELRILDMVGCKEQAIPISVVKKPKIDKSREDCCLLMKKHPEELVFLGSDPEALFDPSREDYIEDIKSVLYDHDSLSDCCSTKALMGLTSKDIAGGLEQIIEKAIQHTIPGFYFGAIEPKNIEQILVDNKDKQSKLRKLLLDMGRLLPVSLTDSTLDLKNTEEKIPNIKPEAEMHYFAPGDAVCVKPIRSNSPIGTVVSANSNSIIVEWQNGKRTAFCLAEALSILSPVPNNEPFQLGDVYYSLPGMTQETVVTLDNFGIDPVSLYSLLSHVRPANQQNPGTENLNKALKVLGLETSLIDGFSLKDTEKYERHQWFESSLPNGVRLIIDFRPTAIIIRTDHTDEYINPEESSNFLDE